MLDGLQITEHIPYPGGFQAVQTRHASFLLSARPLCKSWKTIKKMEIFFRHPAQARCLTLTAQWTWMERQDGWTCCWRQEAV